MREGLSDSQLVRQVRGSRSQVAFAASLGVSQPVISEYEQGESLPSEKTWIKMARLADYPFNVYCWERAGLNQEERTALLKVFTIEHGESSSDKLKDRNSSTPSYPEELKARNIIARECPTEPVTEPLGTGPIGGSPAPLKGLLKTVEDFFDRNPGISPYEVLAKVLKLSAREKGKRGKRKKG